MRGGAPCLLLPCVPADLVWTGSTRKPSPVNPILASVPNPSVHTLLHILLMLSQKDPFCPHGNRSCLCSIPYPQGSSGVGVIRTPFLHPLTQEGGRWAAASH